MARTLAKDHDEKRMQIMTTAAAVFAKDGVDRASMASIAKACGVSKANIYHYHRSKEDLLFDLLSEHLADLRDRVISIDQPKAAPKDRFEMAVKEILSAYQGADNHHRIQMQSLSMLADEKQKVLRGLQRDLVRHVSGIVQDLAPLRFTDKSVLRSTTMSVFGMLNWYFMWNTGAGSNARRAYAHLVSDLVLNGIQEDAQVPA